MVGGSKAGWPRPLWAGSVFGRTVSPDLSYANIFISNFQFTISGSPLASRADSVIGHMKAILALEDGSIFHGLAFGARATACGEVCFNTSMTGYQEILTDPSYKGQIVTMTYPLIGNYGVNSVDDESWRPHVAGFVVRELSPVVSNWRADYSLA